MSPKQEISDLAMWAALAGFGGLARFLVSRMESTAPVLTRAKWWGMAFANITISSFSGIMGALVASGISESSAFVAAVAGTFGFMGAKGLEMLADKLSSKL